MNQLAISILPYGIILMVVCNPTLMSVLQHTYLFTNYLWWYICIFVCNGGVLFAELGFPFYYKKDAYVNEILLHIAVYRRFMTIDHSYYYVNDTSAWK